MSTEKQKVMNWLKNDNGRSLSGFSQTGKKLG